MKLRDRRRIVVLRILLGGDHTLREIRVDSFAHLPREGPIRLGYLRGLLIEMRRDGLVTYQQEIALVNPNSTFPNNKYLRYRYAITDKGRKVLFTLYGKEIRLI